MQYAQTGALQGVHAPMRETQEQDETAAAELRPLRMLRSGAGEEQRIDKFEVLSSKRPLWKRDLGRLWTVIAEFN
jgi:hypothetical protein